MNVDLSVILPLMELVFLGSVVCWVVATTAAFQKESAELGLYFIVGGLVTLGLMPLIVGDIKAREWRMVPVMTVWTGLYLIQAYLIVTLPYYISW